VKSTTPIARPTLLNRGRLCTIPYEIGDAASRLAAKWRTEGIPTYIELHRADNPEPLWFDYKSLDQSYLDILRSTVDYHVSQARRLIDQFVTRGRSTTAHTAARHIMLARLYHETAMRIEDPDREIAEYEMPFPVMTLEKAEAQR